MRNAGWVFAVLSSVLASCGSANSSSSIAWVSSGASNSESSVSAVSEYEGYWQSDAYGRVFSVARHGNLFNVETFIFTQHQCLLSEQESGVTAEDLKATAVVSPDNTYVEVNNLELLPGAIFTRVASLPVVCTQSLLPTFGDAGYQFDGERDYQFFWDYFNEYYLDFGLTGTDWAHIYETYLPEAQAATSEEALFDIFSKMVEPLSDPHIYIALNRTGEGHGQAEQIYQKSHKPTITDALAQAFVAEQQLTEPLTITEQEQLAAYVDARLNEMIRSRLSRAKEGTVDSALDEILWFVTEENIGYLLIASMSDFGGGSALGDYALIMDAMETIINDLSATQGLVIDVRINNGGYDLVSAAIASYFFDTPTQVYAKQARLGAGREALRPVIIHPNARSTYTRPVALLTSHSTVSAAEAFALMMRERPQTVIIGEPTAGAFSDMLEARVSSRLFFSLSNEWYLDNQGESFEAVGVPVDFHVPFPSPVGEDYGLDQAMGWLHTGQLTSP